MIPDTLLNISDKLVHFPIYNRNDRPLIKLDKNQLKAIEEYAQKLSSGEYEYEHVNCLCKNSTPESDVIVANKDRYGIQVKFILCKKCALIRINSILKEKDLFHFYEYFYRPIYNPKKATPEQYFNNELTQGRKFVSIFKSHVKDYKINRIFEAGCGSGGILYPFKDIADELMGCDFDVKFLQYGIDKGLHLIKGTMEDAQLEDQSVDLYILSHVLEHIIHPIDELIKINNKIKPGGYLLIEVPGTGQLHRGIFPRFFQNVHLYIFHKKFLEDVMHQLGYKTVFGNEDVTLLFQKKNHNENIGEIEIQDHPQKATHILKYMKFSYLYYSSPFNFHKLKRSCRRELIKFLDYFHLREKLKKVFKKS